MEDLVKFKPEKLTFKMDTGHIYVNYGEEINLRISCAFLRELSESFIKLIMKCVKKAVA